jgi:predicted dehydrogenase
MGKNKRIGLGIVGCGTMGGIHAQHFCAIPGCQVIGFSDQKVESAEALARKHGGKVYAEFDQMLADPAVDAVVIATVQQAHAKQMEAALRAGRHVFCEKPVALTMEEMDAVGKLVESAKRVVMIGHQLRFHPVILAVQKAMPQLGGVFHLDLEMAFRISGHTGRCWENYRSGGFFMELGCHLVDLSRFLLGDIRHVSGTTLRTDPKRVTEDFTQCLLSFSTGASASIITSANHRTVRQGLLRGRILGQKGRIDFTLYPYGRPFNRAVLVFDDGKHTFIPGERTKRLITRFPPSPTQIFPGYFDVYPQEARHFLECIRSGGTPRVTFRDGRLAVEGILATYHQQGIATRTPNMQAVRRRYQTGPACHPLLAK